MTFVRTQYRLRIPWDARLRSISLHSANRIAIAFRLSAGAALRILIKQTFRRTHDSTT